MMKEKGIETAQAVKKQQKRFCPHIGVGIYNIPPTECGDLLSICVLPKWQGSGIANELISDYQNSLRNIGRSVCYLTVATENARGIHFYEKNDFVPYRALGDVAITYAKRI